MARAIINAAPDQPVILARAESDGYVEPAAHAQAPLAQQTQIVQPTQTLDATSAAYDATGHDAQVAQDTRAQAEAEHAAETPPDHPEEHPADHPAEPAPEPDATADHAATAE